MDDDEIQRRFLAAFASKYAYRRALKPGMEGPVFVVEELATQAEVVVKIVRAPTHDGERRFRIPRLTRAPQYVDLVTVEPLVIDERTTLRAIVSRLVEGIEWGSLFERLPHAALPDGRRDQLIVACCASLVDAVAALHAEGHGHGALSHRNVLVTVAQGVRVEPAVMLVDLEGDDAGRDEADHQALDIRFMRKILGRALSASSLSTIAHACLAACVDLRTIRSLLSVFDVMVRFQPASGAGREESLRAAARVLLTASNMMLVGLAPWLQAFREHVFPLFTVVHDAPDLGALLKEEMQNVRIRATAEVTNSVEEAALRAVFHGPAEPLADADRRDLDEPDEVTEPAWTPQEVELIARVAGLADARGPSGPDQSLYDGESDEEIAGALDDLRRDDEQRLRLNLAAHLGTTSPDDARHKSMILMGVRVIRAVRRSEAGLAFAEIRDFLEDHHELPTRATLRRCVDLLQQAGLLVRQGDARDTFYDLRWRCPERAAPSPTFLQNAGGNTGTDED